MTIRYDCNEEANRPLAIGEAAAAVRAGSLVVLPTDTVYGIGADAFAPRAVHQLLAVKGRGRDLPVPVLIGSWRTVNGLVDKLPEQATDLISAFWPGALTLVLRSGTGLAWDLGDSLGTVAVRMPLHPVALELLGETGPLAVSSANKHGQPPARTAEQAQEQLGDEVAIYLDAGPSGDAEPSTIVDLTGARARLLRAGAVERERIADVLHGKLDD
jgi:tRNA threonylcarbamoyl adenosine modification protein (Sua5/YciO/YrdC/YwlC family)